ncbi:MAG: hypothetical protein JRI68_11995 [Deltaproteobacteria bacterium]|nr:hypothetical protein [Deltaproteobacteria bacterium]
MTTTLTGKTTLRFAALAALAPLVIAACGNDDATLGGVAGTGGTAGAGGDLFNDAGTGGLFEGCTSTGAEAEPSAGPATVILFIDNSPSMRDEIEWTRDNLNAFSQTIEDAGLDLRVVVIACMQDGGCDGHDNAWGICVPEPLGADGGCDGAPPLQDNNPPGYLHIDLRIPSQKGLERVIDTYDQWEGMLREGTPLHIVGISDDTEEWSAQQFHDALLAKNPALTDFYFHSISSFQSKEDACLVGSNEPCCLYAAPGGEGVPYHDLSLMTGGVAGDLCDQDFTPVFQQFANAVIESAVLSCDYEIPPPPEGETLDPALVNVVFDDGQDNLTVIGQVPSAAECSGVPHGWYYDDPNNPTTVVMCPQTCTWIQGKEGSSLHIEFGCATEIAKPR